jgi:hypothetical protein
LPNERFEKLADHDNLCRDMKCECTYSYSGMTVPRSIHQPQRSRKECLIPVIDEKRATTLDSDMNSRVPAITFRRLGEESCTVAPTRAGKDNGQARRGAWHIGSGDHDMLCCDERKVSSKSLAIKGWDLGSPVTVNCRVPYDVRKGAEFDRPGACSMD